MIDIGDTVRVTTSYETRYTGAVGTVSRLESPGPHAGVVVDFYNGVKLWFRLDEIEPVTAFKDALIAWLSADSGFVAPEGV
jgi:hypothetical protein